VIHGAALKQVPTAEYNPLNGSPMCWRENLVYARSAAMKRVIALSTTRRPIRSTSMAPQALSDKISPRIISPAPKARFAVVRYGNVVGSLRSAGSLFQKLAAEGAKSLPITDERMTRF
jgi:UDP-N-acetylglucosamine 4,6-dehydratase